MKKELKFSLNQFQFVQFLCSNTSKLKKGKGLKLERRKREQRGRDEKEREKRGGERKKNVGIPAKGGQN